VGGIFDKGSGLACNALWLAGGWRLAAGSGWVAAGGLLTGGLMAVQAER